MEYVGITRSKIYKKQLIEVDGERLLLRGKRELLSAGQIAFTQLEQRAILGENIDNIDRVLKKMSAASDTVGSRVARMLSLDSIASKAERLSDGDKVELARALCPVLNGSYDRVDLSCIGGSKRTGTLYVVFSKLFNDPNLPFVIIDQSETGMFERRTRVGL